MDREQPTVLGRLDNITTSNRRQGQVATQQVQVVARQQNDVTGSKHEVLSILTIDPDKEFTLDDVVIKNQVRCWPESGRAMFWPDAGGHAPWREEIGVQENAASQFFQTGFLWWMRSRPCRPMKSGSSVRYRAAPTPISLVWSSASSM